MSDSEEKSSPQLRRGAWLHEELQFAKFVISCFDNGILRLPSRISLRVFLSKRLMCSTMRISKKRLLAPVHVLPRLYPTAAEIADSIERIKALEVSFRNAVELKEGIQITDEFMADVPYNPNNRLDSIRDLQDVSNPLDLTRQKRKADLITPDDTSNTTTSSTQSLSTMIMDKSIPLVYPMVPSTVRMPQWPMMQPPMPTIPSPVGVYPYGVMPYQRPMYPPVMQYIPQQPPPSTMGIPWYQPYPPYVVQVK